LPLLGQLEIGESSTNMNGTLSVGYDGSYGDSGISSHGLGVGGDLYLNGSYYDPKFLSYNVHPYFNRSQNNSDFQSITDSSGVNATANLFSGSHFPGFFSYNRSYDSNGTFGMPGVSGLTTHGSGQGFSVGWSELLPDVPSLSASYTVSSGSTELYGSDQESKSSNRMFDLHSDYMLSGFRFRGYFQHQTMNADFPDFVEGGAPIESDTSSNSFGLSVDHKIPLNGDIFGSWHRNSYTYSYVGGETNGSSDMFSVNGTMHPVEKLTVSFGTNYTNNLSGSLLQDMINNGAAPPPEFNEFASHSLQTNVAAGYTILPGLYVQGQVNHWNQVLGGRDYSSTQFGGTINYNMQRRFLRSFTFVLGVVDSTTQDGHVGTSLIANVNFSHKFNGWDVGGHFSYSQNLQTLVTIYTTSGYGYGATVRRRLGYRTYWSASATGGHSGLSQFSGYSNESQSFSTSLTHRGYSVSGSFSKSDGTSLFTPAGLIQPPVPAPIVGNDLVMYNARGWSLGAGGSPIHRIQITGSFSKSTGSTVSPTLDSHNYSQMINLQLRYPVRKLYITSGYTNFKQGIGTSSTVPTNVTTYYFGISRWFNFF